MRTEKICRGCFAEWDAQSFSCPWCGYGMRADSDKAGWTTGMFLEKRYLLGGIYLEKSDYVIWRVYDSIMDIPYFFLVSVGGSLEVMRELGWGFMVQRDADRCPVVLALKEIEGRYVLAFSMKDRYLPEEEFISWLRLVEKEPENVIDHIEYTAGQDTLKNVLAEKMILADRYRITGCIGIGGFGITYLCEDILLQRNVAVKEYLPETWAEREGTFVMARSSGMLEAYRYGMKSFMREVKMTAYVLHDRHLVTVYDAFLQNDTAYIVMEYLSGMNIGREMVRRKFSPYTPREMAEIILPVLEGVRELHDRKLIHSDISPANILRTAEGKIVLIDLGASKRIQGGQTVFRAVFLKKPYAAPEQYQTAGAETPKKEGAWTDIYAVGAVMYYLLTGHKPADALSRLSEKKAGLIPPKKYRVKLKKGWMKLIQQCMELDWSKRLSSARQVEEKIRGLLASEK